MLHALLYLWPPADLRQPYPGSIQLLSPPGISKSASQVERIELEDHERNFSEGALFSQTRPARPPPKQLPLWRRSSPGCARARFRAPRTDEPAAKRQRNYGRACGGKRRETSVLPLAAQIGQ
jgi:hypothetical protein